MYDLLFLEKYQIFAWLFDRTKNFVQHGHKANILFIWFCNSGLFCLIRARWRTLCTWQTLKHTALCINIRKLITGNCLNQGDILSKYGPTAHLCSSGKLFNTYHTVGHSATCLTSYKHTIFLTYFVTATTTTTSMYFTIPTITTNGYLINARTRT